VPYDHLNVFARTVEGYPQSDGHEPFDAPYGQGTENVTGDSNGDGVTDDEYPADNYRVDIGGGDVALGLQSTLNLGPGETDTIIVEHEFWGLTDGSVYDMDEDADGIPDITDGCFGEGALNDADGDGICGDFDCDDNAPNLGSTLDDADCDGSLTADDCDDIDGSLGSTLDDADCDGWLTADDCEDGNAEVNPGQSELPYDMVDNDCDPTTPDDDVDGDGFLYVDDCDDDSFEVNPSAYEVAGNDVDENCDEIYGLTLTFTDLVIGEPATFSIQGAFPGARVGVFRSPQGIGQGPCFPQLQGDCMGLIDPVLTFTDLADNTGRIQFQTTIPSTLNARPVWFQAAALSAEIQLADPIQTELIVP
jgi:hypothetical protein